MKQWAHNQEKIVYRQWNNKSEYKHGINYMHELTGVKRSLKIQSSSSFFRHFCFSHSIVVFCLTTKYINTCTRCRSFPTPFTRTHTTTTTWTWISLFNSPEKFISLAFNNNGDRFIAGVPLSSANRYIYPVQHSILFCL